MWRAARNIRSMRCSVAWGEDHPRRPAVSVRDECRSALHLLTPARMGACFTTRNSLPSQALTFSPLLSASTWRLAGPPPATRRWWGRFSGCWNLGMRQEVGTSIGAAQRGLVWRQRSPQERQTTTTSKRRRLASATSLGRPRVRVARERLQEAARLSVREAARALGLSHSTSSAGSRRSVPDPPLLLLSRRWWGGWRRWNGCFRRLVRVVDVVENLPLSLDSLPDLNVFPAHLLAALTFHQELALDESEVAARLRRERRCRQLETRRLFEQSLMVLLNGFAALHRRRIRRHEHGVLGVERCHLRRIPGLRSGQILLRQLQQGRALRLGEHVRGDRHCAEGKDDTHGHRHLQSAEQPIGTWRGAQIGDPEASAADDRRGLFPKDCTPASARTQVAPNFFVCNRP